MANSAQAKKRARQNVKARKHNASLRSMHSILFPYFPIFLKYSLKLMEILFRTQNRIDKSKNGNISQFNI